MMFNKYLDKKGNNIVLFLIILTGAILRLFNAFHIPFTYDELNIISSTSLTEMLAHTNKTDSQPYAIQLFIYCYTQIFGCNEFVVKFPFILSGLTCIWLTFNIGRRWFNEHVGFLSATVIATIQYTVMYSQIAGPFIIGMLLALVLIHFFTYFFIEMQYTWKNTIIIGTLIALSGYIHHIGFVFSLVVLTSGLLFVNKEIAKYYIAIWLLTIALYAPQLPLTIEQLNQASQASPLDKPSSYFLADYIQFIFHYSRIFYFIILFSVSAGIILSWKTLNNSHQKRLLLVIWFTLPFLIAYYYSVSINPIIQFSTLIFGFPFLIILIFSFWHEDLPVWVRNELIVAIAIVSIYSLVVSRQYYSVFYNQNVETFYKKASQDLEKNPKNTLVLSKDINYNHYQHKYGNRFTYTSISDTMSPRAFKALISYNNIDYLVLDGSSPLFVQLAKENFPYVLKREKSFLLDYYVLSKSPSYKIVTEKPVFESTANWSHKVPEWKFNAYNTFKDESGTVVYATNSDEKWDIAFSKPLFEITQHPSNIILASVDVLPLTNDFHLVMTFSIKSGDSTLYWSSRNLVDIAERPFQWVKLNMAYQLNSIIDVERFPADSKLYINIWNPESQDFWLNNFTVSVKNGNEYAYSLFNRIDK